MPSLQKFTVVFSPKFPKSPTFPHGCFVPAFVLTEATPTFQKKIFAQASRKPVPASPPPLFFPSYFHFLLFSPIDTPPTFFFGIWKRRSKKNSLDLNHHFKACSREKLKQTLDISGVPMKGCFFLKGSTAQKKIFFRKKTFFSSNPLRKKNPLMGNWTLLFFFRFSRKNYIFNFSVYMAVFSLRRENLSQRPYFPPNFCRLRQAD